MSLGNEAWAERIMPGFANCFVSFGNRSGQLILSQDAYRCVHITDVVACLLNPPENGLLRDHYCSLISLGLLISLDHCGEFRLPSHPLLKCSHLWDGAWNWLWQSQEIVSSWKRWGWWNWRFQAGISVSPGTEKSMYFHVPFSEPCAPLFCDFSHVTMCPVRFKVPPHRAWVLH